jgi:hypothetical protein
MKAMSNNGSSWPKSGRLGRALDAMALEAYPWAQVPSRVEGKMDESEWLGTDDSRWLLYHVLGSERKFRLFACACARRVWHWLPDARSQAAVRAAEDYADGRVTIAQLAWARRSAQDRVTELEERWDDPASRFDVLGPAQHSAAEAAAEAATSEPRMAALIASHHAEEAFAGAGEGPSLTGILDASQAASERRQQVPLLRDVFPNPFRLVAIEPGWRTPVVMSLAEAAYAERSLPSGELDPARLAVLADALEEAGCADEATLEHLRKPGVHVRGCWPVDLVLGRS